MPESIQASVIIATRNRPEKLRETLMRLADQDEGTTPYEVIVVDDGSESPLQLESLTPARFRIVRQPPLGRSPARNHGAEVASGALLIFVDDDIWVPPDFVQSHCRAHPTSQSQYVVGAIRLPEHASNTPFGRFRQKLEDDGLPVEGSVPPNFCAAANLSIRRDVFLALGGFDPAISSGEDQDLALRAAAFGVHGVYAPEIAVVHNDSAMEFGSYCRRMEWGYRHLHPFIRRHPSFPENHERSRLNGPLCLGREPAPISMKKLVKSILQCWPFPPMLTACIGVVERGWPDSDLLPRLYRMVLGLYIFRGFREGLRGSSEVRDRISSIVGPAKTTRA